MFCLERVNLSEAEHLYPSEISGGMMKRAAIARAIALNPKYLFCDEPNSGLDPKTSLLIDDLIHDITTEYKMTTVINTHDMNSVMNIGENIIFIKEGVKNGREQKTRSSPPTTKPSTTSSSHPTCSGKSRRWRCIRMMEFEN